MRKKLRFDAQVRDILDRLGLIHRGNALAFNGAHADAGESLFILQELQAIEAKAYMTPYGPLDSEKLIPGDESIPAGAKEFGFDRYDEVGIAQWISADAKDIPRADVSRKRVTFPLKSMASSYSFTHEDLLSAVMAGQPLDAMGMMAARRAIDTFKDQVFLAGDTSVGLEGFLNNSNVTHASAVHGAWDGSASTPDQIIADVNNLAYQMYARTKKVYFPDTLVVSPAVYGYITGTPRSSTSDTTIWEFMQRTSPFVRNLEMLLQCAKVANGGIGPGVAGAARAVLYKRDPEVLQRKIAVGFETLPPQPEGFSIMHPCWAKIGGTFVRVPIAMQYIDGIEA